MALILYMLSFILSISKDLEEEKDKPFYESSEKDSSEDDSEDSDDKDKPSVPKKPVYVMDPDHRLLLRQSKPLLNSRNSAVRKFVVQPQLIYLKNLSIHEMQLF